MHIFAIDFASLNWGFLLNFRMYFWFQNSSWSVKL